MVLGRPEKWGVLGGGQQVHVEKVYVLLPPLSHCSAGHPKHLLRLDWTYKLPGGQKSSIKLSPPSAGFPQRIRKILVSVKFVSAILGPEMAAPILWTPGKNAFFLQENLCP